MDVELQILKHLARDAHSIAPVIDDYCAEYKDLFKKVKNYECFKYLHLGIISSIKRKSLPEIAKVAGMISAQSLHHFIANSPGLVNELKNKILNKILKAFRSIDRYDGSADIPLNIEEVRCAIKVLDDAGESYAGYAIDFGVLDSGQTALIEMNDGFAIGAYKIDNKNYTDIILARWEELLSQRAA